MTTRDLWTLLWIVAFICAPCLGCTTAVEDDDDASDDDTGDDDDNAGDDDTGDDDTGDDDTADDDTGDDDTDDDIIGDVYFLDLADPSFTMTEPAGLGAVLQGMLPDDDGAVFTTSAINGSQIDMMFGAAYVLNPNGDEEDWVWEQSDHTTTTGTGSWDGSSFDMQPFSLSIVIDGQDVFLGDAEFTGTYAADGSAVNNTRLSVLMDAVVLSEQYGADLCALLTCETCPNGAPNPGENCLRVTAEGGTCSLLEDLALVSMP